MRRLLAPLVIALLVASGLASIASPSQADAVEGPTLGAGWTLPEPPAGRRVIDAALLGDVVWAVLDGDGTDGRRRSLWTTPTDGAGEWTRYAGDDPAAPLTPHVITSAGGSALTVFAGADAHTVLIHPGGERVLDDIGLVAPGGRLVVRLLSAERATAVETLEGEQLDLTSGPRSSADGGRVWRHDSRSLYSRDLLDGGEDRTITPAAGAACMSGAPQVRGRWLVVPCSSGSMVVDLDGLLPTDYTRRTVWLGDRFAVTDGVEGIRVLDPVTFGETAVPVADEAWPDAADRPRVLVLGSGRLRVVPVSGLGRAAVPDTMDPVVTLDALPRLLDGVAAAAPGAGDALRVPVSWTGPNESARVELREGSGRLPWVDPFGSTHRAYLGLHDSPTCVAVRAVDRAGNAGAWDEHCFTWDRYRPRAGIPSVRASVDGLGLERSFAHRHPITDDGGVARYQHRYRRGDRRGVMGDWSALRGIASDRVNSVVRAGRRACHQIRGIDHFGRAIPWANSRVSCATAPYDDRLLRHAGRSFRPRKPGAFEEFATALPAGSSVTVPELLHGSQLAVKIWQGPDQLGVLDVYRDGVRVRSIAPWSRRRGFAWVLVPRVLRDSGSRITLKAREEPVAIDAIGVRRPGDLYPPAG